MRIIGVDFSGAERENKSATWLAQGRLEGNTFTIEHCHPIIRADLTHKLASLDGPAVVGMDFPFSVPEGFANFWREQHHCSFNQCERMPDLWAAASAEKRVGFEGIAGRFEGMAFRKCDHYVPGAKSPLKAKGNPIMLPMTFQGMKMLHQLWQGSETGKTGRQLRVAPLHSDLNPDAVTLLEVMPGATLDHLGIRRTGYRGEAVSETRQRVLTKLLCKARALGVPVKFTDRAGLYQTIRANDDARDAVVAAITAALWDKDKSLFHRPEDVDGLDWKKVKLEGWLYAPKPLEGN